MGVLIDWVAVVVEQFELVAVVVKEVLESRFAVVLLEELFVELSVSCAGTHLGF